MKYDIITFGSATLDLFLKVKNFSVEKEKEFVAGQEICFPFPSKVDVENIVFATGGGGTNTAATFSKQGFKVGYCGKIGKDAFGKEVLKDLDKFKIDRNFVFKTDQKPTNFSIIFSAGLDRTVFVYRGASGLLGKEEVPWQKIRETSWFYLAPLSGKLAKIFGPLVDFAQENNIKVLANPGNTQINLGPKALSPILEKIDILLLNQQEASLLTGIAFQKEKKVFEKLDQLIPGIAVMTKGKKGVVASDGENFWQAPALPAKVVEKTGAGDAFGSGFLAGYIKTGDIEKGIQMGMANATSCIQKIGAKKGLLKKN